MSFVGDGFILAHENVKSKQIIICNVKTVLNVEDL